MKIFIVTQRYEVSFQPKDITLQLIENESGQKIDVMMGEGRAIWLPEKDTKWDYDTYDWNCNRRPEEPD